MNVWGHFVSGCPTPGFYGWNCSIPCPDRNCRYCRIDTGACQSCKPGYQGHRCENSIVYILLVIAVLLELHYKNALPVSFYLSTECDDVNGCRADYTDIYCRKGNVTTEHYFLYNLCIYKDRNARMVFDMLLRMEMCIILTQKHSHL